MPSLSVHDWPQADRNIEGLRVHRDARRPADQSLPDCASAAACKYLRADRLQLRRDAGRSGLRVANVARPVCARAAHHQFGGRVRRVHRCRVLRDVPLSAAPVRAARASHGVRGRSPQESAAAVRGKRSAASTDRRDFGAAECASRRPAVIFSDTTDTNE